uniref:Gremlin 2, DAN family BMP antagonist a n=1 Tax=Neogobius melanostomus TaxID=47308 RepID=A0A8C6SNX6_9GOBI
MLWRLTLPFLLAGVLCITAETRKPRPQGSIPSPYKSKGNLSSERQRLLQKKPEVLSSSREALVVTERRYLRRDWCKTQPLRQTVSEEGCISRTVVNRFCYGQCNSFYIPRHMGPSSAGSGRKHHNKLQEPFQSCSFCSLSASLSSQCSWTVPVYSRHSGIARSKESNSVAACLWTSAAMANSENQTHCNTKYLLMKTSCVRAMNKVTELKARTV